MDVAIPHYTKLVNLTEFPLQFVAQARSFTIPSLNPGCEQLVNSSKILKISRRLESASWPIKVIKDGTFSGLKLEARHFLDYVLIAFEIGEIEILVAKGIKEREYADMFLRMGRGFGPIMWRNRIWKKRNFEMIAKAPEPTGYPVVDQHISRMRNENPVGSITEIRGGRVSRFSGQHMEGREHMDSFDYMFLFLFAFVVVTFLKVLL